MDTWRAKRTWGLILLLWAAGAVSVYADELVLSNGDVLHGKVISVTGGKVEFESGPLGLLRIDATEVRRLRTEQAVCMIASQGEPAWWSRVEVAEPNRLVLHDASLEYGMPLSEVYAAGTAAELLLTVAEDRMAWTGNLEAGISGRSGNARRVAASGRMSVEGQNSRWGVGAWARGLYAVQERDGEDFVTDNEAMAGGRVTRRLGDGLSAYLRGELERDKIELLRLRALLNGGLSLAWYEDERLVVANRAGLGKQQEWFDGTEESMHMVGELAGEARYKVNSHLELSHETVWVVNLDSCDRYDLRSESAATVYLDDDRHFFLKSGLTHQYDNDVPEGVERLDTYYFTNLGYRW